jgi:type IV secretory pathway TraG/TraD family ATPase VirD4
MKERKKDDTMKNITITVVAVIIAVIITAVSTFVATMNNLHITVNEESNGALVECFGQEWYHDTEELNHLVEIEDI